MTVKPFVSYIGTKSKMMTKLSKYFPENINNYFEPFVGGGSVFLYISQNYEIKKSYINDIDRDIIDAFKCVKHSADILIDGLRTLNKPSSKTKKAFVKIVDLYNNRDELETSYQNKCIKSAMYIYLTKMAYNSKLNYYKDGSINPYYSSSYKTTNIYNEKHIRSVTNILKATTISRLDYREFLKKYPPKKNDFVFFDPPYLVNNVKQYYKDTFIHDNFVNLKTLCDSLDKRSVNWMITLNKNEKLRDLFSDYQVRYIKKFSHMSGNGLEYEMIITNY